MMSQQLDINFQGTTIMARNLDVDRFNERRLSYLDTKEIRFPSHRFGKQEPEWKKHIPEIFESKMDALVMILVNKTIGEGEERELLYVNGDLGYIRDVTEKTCIVELLRDGTEVEVGYTTKLKKEKDQDGKEQVVGSCEHIPLRTAYATTCHKSQGLTLDNVQVNLNAQFFGHGGMSYVALSRARTQGGLHIIVGNPNTFIKRCKTNPKVDQWL